MACGPLIAGVVGAEKPLYDIWGDTVNMASRLESTGERGQIHISEEVNNFLRRRNISSTYRGLTKIRGKPQPIPTYFVDVARFIGRRQHVIGRAASFAPASFRWLDSEGKPIDDRFVGFDEENSKKKCLPRFTRLQ